MVFSRFIWSILAFVAAIVGTSILLGIYLQKPEFPVTTSLLVVALVLETIATGLVPDPHQTRSFETDHCHEQRRSHHAVFQGASRSLF